MKVAVVGSRSWSDPSSICRRIAELHIEWHPDLTIVSGGCPTGPDRFAKDKAWESKIPYLEFPADWETYGKAAGFRRNEDIIKAADLVIAFWDGKSAGTKNSIDLALRHHKDLEVHFT